MKKQNNKPLLIAGPCVIENQEICDIIATEVNRVASLYSMIPVFKGSFEKANRTSHLSFKGIDRHKALDILSNITSNFKMLTITDVHSPDDVEEVKDSVTWLQIPAFLSRQTDLIIACSNSMKPTLIKKGQFLSPEACEFVANKFRSGLGKALMICERGFSFGYNDLIVDATTVPRIKSSSKCPVIVDCTHSLQKPNRNNGTSGGNPSLVGTLANFAFATGAGGIFIEVHPDPKSSPSDSESILELNKLEEIVKESMKIYNALNGKS